MSRLDFSHFDSATELVEWVNNNPIQVVSITTNGNGYILFFY